MERLARKFEKARKLVPARSWSRDGTRRSASSPSARPILRLARASTRSSSATDRSGLLRIRAYPFAHEIHDFVASHERVYVVEQNRDAQLASLLKLDLPADQVVKLRSILHYNGLPVDAASITEEFAIKEGL
jgi:2-oxoglutarate/2-oxoacid ferredoxin oxidoreductase subunit alpha